MGAWVTYGLGSECADLPGFVVMQSGPRGPRGGAVLWGSGVLPTTYQGVPLRNTGDPIVNLSTPESVTVPQQRQLVDAVRELNLKRLVETGDEEISTRINAYEMAYKMQTSAPELMDISGETQATLDLYGIKDAKETSFARNCLLARRLVERGVRFVQIDAGGWDHHTNLVNNIHKTAAAVDQPAAALITDLKQRGLLDQTLIIWGGEFGRTVNTAGGITANSGRDHWSNAFCCWLAGGGVRGGQMYGETDDLGREVVKDGVHVHDLHATILRLLGFDHTKLTYRYNGRDFRLTDNFGQIVSPIIA
jgi:uncharacterized protein (DUF1501 family)